LPEKVAILNVNLFSIKIAYIKKVVFWLPYKILIHYKCTYCEKATDEIDVSSNWSKDNFFLNTYYKSTPKLK
jgi:hypothetical protein